MQHDVLGLIFGFLCIVIGAALLYDGVTGRDPMQAETIAGAAILSFGAMTLGVVLRNWVRWRRELRKFREG
jgi:hypothetical protein